MISLSASQILSHYSFEEGQTVIFQIQRRPAGSSSQTFSMHLPAEMGVVLEGSMVRFYKNERRELHRGGIWINGILEPHSYARTEEKTVSVVFIIKPEFLFGLRLPGISEPFWRMPFETPPESRPQVVSEEVARQAESLVETLEQGENREFANAAIKLTLLNMLYQIVKTEHFAVRPSVKEDDIERVGAALELLHQPGARVSTADAARHCGLSTALFARLFTRATGLSFSRYSLRFRLAEAARELQQTSIQLDELADKWGFSDKSHFVHRFRAHFNMTPGEFRKNQLFD